MAWNEPDDKNKKDPWSGKNQSPPDIEDIIRNVQRKFRRAFGGGSSSGNDDGGIGALFAIFAVIAIAFWALSGIFIVGPAEKAAILRFGKHIDTVGPGPHWIPRFIDRKYVQNVDRRSKYEYTAQMLTKDENIVQVSITVIYRIGNLKNYLFNVTDPKESLQQATASALRQVVGHTSLDQILTEGREVWGAKVETLLSEILGQYKAGMVIVKVSPQPARAPQTVQDAFDDAIMAQEDEKRFIEKAKSYSEKKLPIARGQAKRIYEEAEAKAQEYVLKAEGNVAEFLALLPQYRLSPRVLQDRMYIDSIETVLRQTSKILVDSKSGNLLYLPLQQLLDSSALKNRAKDLADKEDSSLAAMTPKSSLSTRTVDFDSFRRSSGRTSRTGRRL